MHNMLYPSRTCSWINITLRSWIKIVINQSQPSDIISVLLLSFSQNFFLAPKTVVLLFFRGKLSFPNWIYQFINLLIVRKLNKILNCMSLSHYYVIWLVKPYLFIRENVSGAKKKFWENDRSSTLMMSEGCDWLIAMLIQDRNVDVDPGTRSTACISNNIPIK